MDVSDILDPLNDIQREAVSAPPEPVLVLAGAGSGKTRVLVHRIAWLIRVLGVSPHGVLAVTFTNKAAAEMRSRIEQLLNMPVGGMWVGTFHGLAHRLLRMHWREAKLPQTFHILDSEDQLRVVRRLMRNLEMDDTKWPPKQVQGFINARKDEGLRAAQIQSHGDFYQQQMGRIYQAYEETCRQTGVVDFAELLLRSFELFRDDAEICAHYQQRFEHILVDEFQDTNTIQYAWLKLLAGKTGKLFAVGDDDQSIYGWRGAQVENMHTFSKDYPSTRLIRLEQNYRSTSTILKAANAIISNNSNRLGKNLWTSGAQGEQILLYAAFNELDEARFIVERIRQWTAEGNLRSEAAILYRSNAQSRVLEEALLLTGMPYRIYGGLRFFDRAEIKDALAYLRIAANRDDDASFERIINTPTRGIGDRSLDMIRLQAKEARSSLWQATRTLITKGQLTNRAANALAGFIKLIEDLAKASLNQSLEFQVQEVITVSGLIEHHRKEKGEKGEMRVENLEELINAARQYEQEEQDPAIEVLSAFLAHAALEAGDTQSTEWDDAVQLMTLHSAKGLEFPLVFLSGLEERLFPHPMSAEQPGRLEEERRLCYVGITRAKRQLYFTYAESRRVHGTDSYFSRPSRFISEIPRELIEDVRPRMTVKRPVAASENHSSAAANGLRIGQRVMHGKFGEGMVLNCEGQGDQARVQVNFQSVGSKWLVLSYANLMAI